MPSAIDQASSTSAPLRTSPVTAGWIIRRSALWAAILVASVSSACLLYAAASNATSEAAVAAESSDAQDAR